jgi:predicted Rossmann-fold nucleotide-binding protein
LLNSAGYFDALLAWLDHSVDEQFVRPEHRRLLLQAEEPGRLLDLVLVFRPAGDVPKWIGKADL